MQTKKWYTSKTLWVNALVLAATALGLFPNSKVAIEILAGVNLVLRLVTNSGLKM